ncbi:MAG: L-lactate MFS transporter [Proteocatella sp.]
MEKRWIYIFLGIIIMMCLGTVYSWSVFRVPVEVEFLANSSQSGMPYMTSLAFYSAFMCLTGKYLDKYNPRKILILGLSLVSLGWILSYFTKHIYMLTLTYGVIIGSGVGIAYGVPMTTASKWFPEKKGLAVGLVLVGFGMSPLVTAPIARFIVEHYGVMNTFLILGVAFGIIGLILSIPIKYPDDEFTDLKVKSKAGTSDFETKEMIRNSNFKWLYLSFFIGTTIGLKLVGITGNIGLKLIEMSSKDVAVFISMFAIFNGIGRPFFGWFVDKYSVKHAMFLSYTMILLASIIMIFVGTGNSIMFGIAFSIFWFNLGGWLAIAPSATMKLYGTHHYSQNYGVVFTAYGIGAVVGVSLSGMLLNIFPGYSSLFYFVFALSILGFIVAGRLDIQLDRE